MTAQRPRLLSVSLPLSLSLVVIAACGGPQANEARPPQVGAPAPEVAALPASLPEPLPPAAGEFTLEHGDGAVSHQSWSAPEGHVFCRWYPEPERGDYLWIRLAQTPEQDGDAGPRLDIDVCRLAQRPSGRYEPMPAGAHGSHCGPQPGFSVWWHEGDDAYNNGAGDADPGCTLEIEFDAESMMLTGEFACPDLTPAAHGQTQEPELRELGPASVSVSKGRFRCEVQRVPVKLTCS